jgi:hypothetical protein
MSLIIKLKGINPRIPNSYKTYRYILLAAVETSFISIKVEAIAEL